MPALFVSHNSRDNAEVARLRDWLAGQGYLSLFLDFDPQRGIPAGARWEAELYSQLRRADAVLFVGSAASVASPWCFAELAMARSLGKPIIPVMLAGDGVHPLLADVQRVDLAGGDGHALDRLARALRLADLDPEHSFDWDSRRSPFPGLEAFEERDAGVFFGRGPEIEALLELLGSTRRRYTGRLLAVVGPSGSGKSSLVAAGLVPRLRRIGGRWLVAPVVRPGDRPERQLALALTDGFRGTPEARSLEQVERALRAGADGLIGLAEELSHLRADDARPDVLVVVDQAEELVTAAGRDECERFLRLLHAGTRGAGPLWGVLTLRSEFLSALLEREGGAQLFDEQLLVGPLERSRLAEVIARPAARTGIDFAPGLIGRMVEDTGGGDALPLLAYTLRVLHQRALRGPRPVIITAEDYDELGGVVGALRRSADHARQDLRAEGLGEVVLPTLTRLVTLGPEGQPTRRAVARQMLDEREARVIDALLQARLLTSSQRDGEAVVEVAHEALLRRWPPLTEAIAHRHEELRLRSELERAAHEWQSHRRHDDYLLLGERLQAARRLITARDTVEELTQLEQDFLAASEQRHEQAQTAKRRRTQRALAGLLTSLFVVSTLAVYAFAQADRAADQARQRAAERDNAQAALLVTNALAELNNDPGQSLSLAIKAYDKKPSNRTESVVRLTASRASPQVTLSHPQRVVGAFAPDGRHLATATEDGTVRVWDWRSRRAPTTTLRVHTEPIAFSDRVYGLAFAPDGRHLATASPDGTVRVWDWRVPRTPPTALRADTDMSWGVGGVPPLVTAVAFAPDGRHLASISKDGRVRVWDWRAPRTQPTTLPQTGVWGVAFAPDGSHIATASPDGMVRVWDWRALRTPPISLRHNSTVYGVAFAPDGRHLATAGEDRTVRVWDWRAVRTPPISLRQTAPVYAVAFAPDERHLATAGDDRTVRVWDWRAPRTAPTTLRGHNSMVWGVAFARGGRHLASASPDGTVRVWDWRALRTSPTVLPGHTDPITGGVAIARGGRHLASASPDGTVRVWDWRAPRRPPTILRGHTAPISGVAFAPDGRHLATGGGEDLTVRVWDWRAPRRPPTILRPHTDAASVYAVAFAPDGRHVASTSDADDTVRVSDWRAPSAPPTTLGGTAGGLFAVAFAPDGRHLAGASGDGTVPVWDWRTPRTPPTILRGHTEWIHGVAFAPDGTRLATASDDGTVRVWDWRAPRTPPTTLRHTAPVYAVAFAPDGRHLATASGRTVRVWDWRAPRTPPTTLRGHTDLVWGVAFASDGRHLASISEDGTVRVWKCQRCGHIRDVLALARSRVPRVIIAP